MKIPYVYYHETKNPRHVYLSFICLGDKTILVIEGEVLRYNNKEIFTRYHEIRNNLCN